MCFYILTITVKRNPIFLARIFVNFPKDFSLTGTVPIHRFDINTNEKCHSTFATKQNAERRMENKCKLYLEATQFITTAKVVICSIICMYGCSASVV